jgi:ankyrin repeat protein
MKHLLITTIAAVVLVGCGESQQSAPAPEAPTVKAPDISIHDAAEEGNIEAVKQHLAAGTDVNTKGGWLEVTPLHYAADGGLKEIVELLIAEGADVNAKDKDGWTPLHNVATKEIAELLIAKGADVNAKGVAGITPLDWAIPRKLTETADLLRKHGGKTGEELKAEGK